MDGARAINYNSGGALLISEDEEAEYIELTMRKSAMSIITLNIKVYST